MGTWKSPFHQAFTALKYIKYNTIMKKVWYQNPQVKVTGLLRGVSCVKMFSGSNPDGSSLFALKKLHSCKQYAFCDHGSRTNWNFLFKEVKFRAQYDPAFFHSTSPGLVQREGWKRGLNGRLGSVMWTEREGGRRTPRGRGVGWDIVVKGAIRGFP